MCFCLYLFIPFTFIFCFMALCYKYLKKRRGKYRKTKQKLAARFCMMIIFFLRPFKNYLFYINIVSMSK